MKTTHPSSLTNSLFQVIAREFQKNGFTVYGTQADEVRKQIDWMVTTVQHSPRSEGHSEIRESFRPRRPKHITGE